MISKFWEVYRTFILERILLYRWIAGVNSLHNCHLLYQGHFVQLKLQLLYVIVTIIVGQANQGLDHDHIDIWCRPQAQAVITEGEMRFWL